VNPVAAKRYPEIDFLKGLACALMLFGHALRVKMPPPGAGDKILLHLMDFSGPIFFFVSGMNVMTFMERNRDKPGFAATKFYLWSAALLFSLGYCYNLAQRTLGFLDIFQCVAICTAVVYLLLRTRLPTWAHFLIVGAIYLVYLNFRVGLQFNPLFVQIHNSLTPTTPMAEMMHPEHGDELYNALRPATRFWFAYFSPFFWIVFFYIGALCYRSVTGEGARAWPWAVFFAAIMLVAPFAGRQTFAPGKSLLDAVFLKDFLELGVRGIPSYVLMTLGGAGLAYLFCRRFYRGAAAFRHRAARWLAAQFEGLGKESLMFLVVHWVFVLLVILLARAVTGALGRTAPGEIDGYLRATVALVATMFAVPRLAAVRDRWSARPHFGRRMGVAMALCLLLAFPARIFVFGVSLGFAFVFPYLRGRLRKKYTTTSG